jgi:hypothetical protein
MPFTGSISGVPGASLTTVIQFPSIITSISVTDNLIDSPLFQHIQVNYLYENTQMDIRGNLITRLSNSFINIVYPFPSSLLSQERMIIRVNETSPYNFDYSAETLWVQD